MIWKDIPGYEGYYQACVDGRIKSLKRLRKSSYDSFSVVPERIMSQSVNTYRNNYHSVMLCKDGKNHRMFVHKIIALTFPEICGEYKPGAEVDHIDGNPANNSAYNLRWVYTRKENMANPITREKCRNAWTEERREIRRQIMKINNPRWMHI